MEISLCYIYTGICQDICSFIEYWFFSKISRLEHIIEIQNSGRMVQNHLVRILTYFDNWFTNAFVSNLRWFKNQNYMLYRIITKFSWNF